jgi:hypothetical protein
MLRLILLALMFSLPTLFAETRFGVVEDTKTYPQASPKETLASLIKATEAKKIDYLVAHLAEPPYIDQRVKETFGGKFAEQVDETRGRLDLVRVKLLKKLAEKGKWKIEEKNATVEIEESMERPAYFVKIGEKWYLRNNMSGK